MSNNKIDKVDEIYELETKLQNPSELRAIQEKVQARAQKLKTILRQGGEKKDFDQMQTLLHGYLAMEKVFQRATRKMS